MNYLIMFKEFLIYQLEDQILNIFPDYTYVLTCDISFNYM